MSETIQNFLDILDLERLEVNLFRGHSPQNGWQRVFGGQVIGQALVAAARTVEDKTPHSLHAYFLRPGDPKVPIIYEVERVRDGKSFTTRRVLAIQHGEPIFALSTSFQKVEAGYEHQMPMPQTPAPQSLPTMPELAAALIERAPDAVKRYFLGEMAIEMRPVNLARYSDKKAQAPEQAVWFKATSAIPDNPMYHLCVLAYASDLTLLDASLIPHNKSIFEPDIQAASLDHAMWFHHQTDMSQWHLYVQDSPCATNSRGFSRGLVYNQAGLIVASVVQEGLIRPRPDLSRQ